MIRRLLALGLAWLAFTLPCSAQSGPLAGVFNTTAASAYSGPGDIVSGAGYWGGLRAYTAAIAVAGTQKLANVRRASDSQTCDFLVATNGGVGNSTSCSGAFGAGSLSSFCNATSCFVVTLYDQSGNIRDATQATTTKQPSITLNCLGSLPCMSFTSAGVQTLITPSFATGAQPASYSGVYDRTGSFTTLAHVVNMQTNNMIGVAAAANTLRLGCSTTVTEPGNDNAWHAVQGVCSNTNSAMNVDGMDFTSLAAGATSPSTGTLRISSGALDGNIAEVGAWFSTTFTPTQRTNMCHNQYLYWGTSTSC